MEPNHADEKLSIMESLPREQFWKIIEHAPQSVRAMRLVSIGLENYIFTLFEEKKRKKRPLYYLILWICQTSRIFRSFVDQYIQHPVIIPLVERFIIENHSVCVYSGFWWRPCYRKQSWHWNIPFRGRMHSCLRCEWNTSYQNWDQTSSRRSSKWKRMRRRSSKLHHGEYSILITFNEILFLFQWYTIYPDEKDGMGILDRLKNCFKHSEILAICRYSEDGEYRKCDILNIIQGLEFDKFSFSCSTLTHCEMWVNQIFFTNIFYEHNWTL